MRGLGRGRPTRGRGGRSICSRAVRGGRRWKGRAGSRLRSGSSALGRRCCPLRGGVTGLLLWRGVSTIKERGLRRLEQSLAERRWPREKKRTRFTISSYSSKTWTGLAHLAMISMDISTPPSRHLTPSRTVEQSFQDHRSRNLGKVCSTWDEKGPSAHHQSCA